MNRVQEAFDRGLQYLENIARSHVLSTTALEIMSYAGPLHDNLQELMREQIDWTAPGSVHRIPPEQLGEVIEAARQAVEDGFTLLHAQSLVAYWSGLEALVEDIVVTWLQENPGVLKSEALRKVKVKLADFIQLDDENRLRLLIQSLETVRGKQGVAAFESLLEVVALSGDVDEDVRKLLFEPNQIRHIVVHRASVPDAKFLEAMGAEPSWYSERVRISEPKFRAYSGAVFQYAYTLEGRIRGGVTEGT